MGNRGDWMRKERGRVVRRVEKGGKRREEER